MLVGGVFMAETMLTFYYRGDNGRKFSKTVPLRKVGTVYNNEKVQRIGLAYIYDVISDKRLLVIHPFDEGPTWGSWEKVESILTTSSLLELKIKVPKTTQESPAR